jgi:peroxiredoxin Q/BCP
LKDKEIPMTTHLKNFVGALALALLGIGTAYAATETPSPALGTVAPSFTLQDQGGKTVSLAEQRGKWVVLYFYPKDNTPGCTTQACGFRDDIFAFRRANAVILGVSVDEVMSKKDFAEKYSLPFPVLSDAKTEVSKAYGVLVDYPQYKIFNVARRDTFIIDPQGKVAKYYREVNPDGHSKVVLADLAKLQGK